MMNSEYDKIFHPQGETANSAYDRIFHPQDETAKILKVSGRTLERWRLEGIGPVFHKFGRRVLYARADLIEWADQRRRSSTSDDQR